MDYHPPVDGALLPRFQAWKEGLSPGGAQVQDVRLWNYLYHEATADLAVAFATLFWPDFVEIDGYVLLAEHFRPANFADWLVWQHEKEAASWQVEAVLNEVHLYDVFKADAALAVLEYLAGVMLRCWRTALHETFPDRRFAFDYATEPTAYGPTLTFWQAP